MANEQSPQGEIILSEEEERAINRRCWFTGDLRHLLRNGGQRRIYEWVETAMRASPNDARPIIINAHRRLGKSSVGVLRGLMRCLARPWQIVRFGAPTQKDAKDIVEPIIRQFLAYCPPEIRPRRQAHVWSFRNPLWQNPEAVSEFILIGLKEDAESQRGKGSDLIILDEARFVKRELRYMVEDIFGWHFAQRPDPEFWLLSTPPRSSSHDFVGLVDDAVRDNRYIKLPITDNPDFTEEDRRQLIKICRGEHSIAWQREALCEFVMDARDLVVPEFREVKSTIVVDAWERPGFFFPWVFADFGYHDSTAILLAWIDFKNQVLVIEDEVVVRNCSTGQIADLLRKAELRVFGDVRKQGHTIRRIADNTAQGIEDWRKDQGIPFRAAERHDPDVLCAALRTAVWEKRIRIHRRCEKLIYQLENGMRNERGKFERSEDDRLGHLDAIAALMYGWRAVNFLENPDPPPEAYCGFDTIWSAPREEEPKAFVRHPLQSNISIRRATHAVVKDYRMPRKPGHRLPPRRR